MAKDNPYWCDDCGCAARDLSDVFSNWNGMTGITWCPGCGRLEDDNGTVTPRDSRRVASRIAQTAVDALGTDGGHHKQWYLEQILEMSAGEEAAHEMYWQHQWREGIEP